MVIFDDQKIEQLISQCRFAETAAALAVSRAENVQAAAHLRHLRNIVSAIAGNDRALARSIEPDLLACRTAAEMDAYRESINGAGFHDDLIGGTVLAWSADAEGAYRLLRQAHERAVSERYFHFAVAARERLAHHALLFGDVEMARVELDQASQFAAEHRLPAWLVRCLAGAARLAFDTGDLDGSARLLDRAAADARSPALRALCAPCGAQLAVERGDDMALSIWTSAEIVETALRSEEPEAAIAASIALLIGSDSTKIDLPAAVALRRALFGADNAAIAPELFSLAASHGQRDEARLAARALAATFAPNRRYLKAHYLLARAYLSFRIGKHAAWTDHASDAARAFNAMGLRRWTNEAMLLLVRQVGSAARAPGRSGSSTLTEREQQVADLIRRGARNREVAVTLQISEHTVERHVSSILGRLGLRSRWQIVDMRKQNEH